MTEMGNVYPVINSHGVVEDCIVDPGEKVVECNECLALNVISDFNEFCYNCGASLQDVVIKLS